MTGINNPILLPTGGTDGNYHLNKASYRGFGFRDSAGIGQIRQIPPASYRGPGWQDEMAKSKAKGGATKGANRMGPAVVAGARASGRVVAGAGALGRSILDDDVVGLVGEFLATRLPAANLSPAESSQLVREAFALALLAFQGTTIDRARVCQVAASAAQDAVENR